MPHIVNPKVFLIAETRIVGARNIDEDGASGLHGFLDHLGVADWRTDAASEAEKLLEVAGKTCYLSFSTELNKNLTRTGARNNFEYLQKGIIGTKHGSVLEHATVTLIFADVSRVFTHELVRHRVGAAYSQVSGRYVRSDDIGYFVPSVIRENSIAARTFHEAFETMERWVDLLTRQFDLANMKDFTLKKTLTSAFRRVIGNGQSNHIVATFNHRTLRHLIELRTSRAAEEEIRFAFGEVFFLVSKRYPAIYADANVEVVDGLPEITFAASKI